MTPTLQVERYREGWRSGKPVEDPDKLKRWGFVGAKPSEFLVTTRRGEVDPRRSGQGRRIFKWPWEAVAIVPTTLQRIEFTADQITREHVGVTVTGIAVFRIAEPLLAFRVLNFTYAEAASEKLSATMREMFVGAARRLIANLSLAECLTRRKETIARYLVEEIAPVVGGEGRPDDATDKGWGVVIDTIEIQQVTITSSQVFAHLQAPFRSEIAARAELAEIERQRQVAERRADAERVETETAAQLARRKIDLDRERALHQIQIAEEQRRAKAAAEVAALDAERARHEAVHAQRLLEAEQARVLELQRQEAEHAANRRQADLALELRHREAEARDHENQLEIVAQARAAELEERLAQHRLAARLVEGLPQIAAALKQEVGSLTYVGGDTGPLNAVPAAFAQLLALAKSFGIKLPES